MQPLTTFSVSMCATLCALGACPRSPSTQSPSVVGEAEAGGGGSTRDASADGEPARGSGLARKDDPALEHVPEEHSHSVDGSGVAEHLARHLRITAFAVGPDQTLNYPASELNGFADDHTTFLPPAANGAPYLVFGGASASAGVWGAVVLQTTDLKTFSLATSLGYRFPVLASPIKFSKCDPANDSEFDENYAAPGSVVQDPTLPAGNMIMLYAAEHHCPKGVWNRPFYSTVGFARSSDNGKTWPAPMNGAGGPSRHVVLQSQDPEPPAPHDFYGDALPSGFVDKSASGDHYLYVAYSYFTHPGGQSVRVARAKLGAEPLTFLKWYNGSFSERGIGGRDSAAMPSSGCDHRQENPEISYNDDVGLYVMLYRCSNGASGAWYYSTATSLDLEDWAAPQEIQNSRRPVISGCAGRQEGAEGHEFDGTVPSTMSPGAAAGHTKLTGYVFFTYKTCIRESRRFLSRAFTITAQPLP